MTMSATAMQALESRGLDVELADRMGLGSVRRDGTEFLEIPCLRDGRIHRRKFRTISGEKKFSQEGEGPIPWNEDVLRDADFAGRPLIITEGELDALTAIQCGFPRTISVPDGAPQEASKTPFDQKRYAWILDLGPRLNRKDVPEIILATDGDAPGAALLQDLSVMLGRFRCKFLTYPMARGGDRRLKDLNEVLVEYGQKGVVETINRAAFVQSEGVFRMQDLPDLPPAVCYAAGFPLFDANYRVRMGDLAVVTGIPSHGKSAFMNDFLCRLANRHGFRVAWASFEQEPQRDHRRALRLWFRKHAVFMESLAANDLARDGTEEEADEWIDRHHRFIIPSEDADITLDWMMERLEQAVVQHDCQVCVIDPFNEMDHMRERNETETEYVGRAIKRFKRFAKAFQVHLIIVAHPTKMRPDEKGKIPMPTLYDIAGSANWNNKADVGLIIHRETEDDTLIKVAKSRYHGQIGAPGTVRMQFSKEDLHYRETDRVA